MEKKGSILENMVMNNLFNGIYKNKNILITGHTGFKGSWLTLWLKKMGAKVIGYALKPPTIPNHFDILNLEIETIIGDIRDRKKLNGVFNKYLPEIIFHLAAQPIVKKSYDDPIYTLETNIIGTANIYEECKKLNSVKAIINITSDKCYENKEWVWGYRENDAMGGYDPYSVSKGCSELITSAYRNSFFNITKYKKTHNILLASCRAGNVIGGGDWGADRLIPDIVKAASKNQHTIIRNPNSTRPWQHVLDALSGYLLLGQKLLEGKTAFSEAWNFGPSDNQVIDVEKIAKISKNIWKKIEYRLNNKELKQHESNMLKLDCSKANSQMGWYPKWNIAKTINKTINWYKSYYENNCINSYQDLTEYCNHF